MLIKLTNHWSMGF